MPPELMGYIKSQLDMSRLVEADPEILGRYSATDAESTWLLWDKVLRPVWNTFGAYREMHQDWMHGENGNQRHLVWQKLRGVAIDTGRAETLRAALAARLAELEDEFRAHPDVAAHVQAMEAEVVQEIANREPSRWKKLPGDGGGVPSQYTKSGAVSKSWLSWHEKQARARQLLADIQASEARDDGQAVGTAVEFQSSHWTGWYEKLQRAKAARHFNLRSSEQKRQLFYDRMGLEVLVWTEPDNPNSEPQPGTDEEAMKGWGEAGKVLMTYATVEKLRSTIESLQEKLDSEGRYHPELRVPGTQTGRLSGSGGFNWQNCFPGYTEVLTKAGWVRLDELPEGTEVFTANTDLTGQFALPTNYIKQPFQGALTVWGSGENESVEMTGDHNLLLFPSYKSAKDPDFWVQAASAPLPKSSVLIARAAKEVSASADSESDLWKVFALQADGAIRKDRPGVFTAGFKKPHKIEKMRELFGKETNTYNGVTVWAYIKFQHERLTSEKTLNLSGLGTKWKDVVLACARFWDGNGVKNGGFEYVSTIEKNVDELQAYLTRCGVTTKKAKYSNNWRLYVSNGRSFKTLKENLRGERKFTGDVYCVSVPSGFIVIRQKGATWVVGNCAKRKEFLEIFRAPEGKVLMFADIAALEPATLAQRSQDPTYLMVYGPDAKPTDIYLQVAANLGGELGAKIRATGFDPKNPTAEAVTKAKKEAKKERNIAKLLHLSANYGAGPGKIRMGLSEQGIEVSLGEAKRLHSAYWGLFAQVKKYEKWLKAQWERNGGWWLNPIGRPVCADERKLKDLCNVDCQSGGHDIFLLFTKVLAEELDKRGIVYQPWNYDIHDCTALEIDEGDVDEVREVVDKVVPDKVNALLGGVVRLKWEANFVKCWAEDKTESPSIDELGVKL